MADKEQERDDKKLARESSVPLFLTCTADGFECVMCGGCCIKWDVILEKEAYHRIREAMEKDPLPEGISFDEAVTLKESATELEYALITQRDGRCFFLNDQDLCVLHKQYGVEIKGWVCKSFPYLSYETPSGLTIYPLFSCRGMLKSLLETAGDDGKLSPPRSYTGYAELGPGVSFTGDRALLFYNDIMINGEAFELVRQSLCQIISLPGIPIEDRLLMGRFFLDELEQNTNEKLLKVDDAWNMIQAVFDDIGCLLKKINTNMVNPALHIKITDMMIQIRLQAIMLDSEKHSFGQVIKDFGFFKDSADVREQRFSALYHKNYLPALDLLTPMLNTYLVNKIIAGPNLFQGGVIASYHTVILLYILVRLVVVAESDKKPIDKALLSEAIYMVEKTFSHNPRLFDFWKFGAENPQTLTPLFATVALKI